MSPSKSIIPNDTQLDCRHVVGITAGRYPAIHIDEQLRLIMDGGMEFKYCPMCGLELEAS